MSAGSSKIAIIGAGSVGTAIAYASMIRGVARRIVIQDLNRKKVDAEVLDLNHGLQFVPAAEIEGSDDPAICDNADIIVITAGAKQKPDQTRLDLAQSNAAICKDLVPKLQKVAPNAIFLLVTNPVDVITYVTLKISGLPPSQVLGSGTVLDSSRFRFLIARQSNVAVQNVHAYIAGEHGDSEVPLWSSATIGNIPIAQWSVPGHDPLSDSARNEIVHSVKNAAYQIIAGKGATNYAIGLSTARILEAILKDEHRVLPVSSLLTDWRGISDVCMSIPSIVNRRGIEAVLPIPVSEDELTSLRTSAAAIRHSIRAVGF